MGHHGQPFYIVAAMSYSSDNHAGNPARPAGAMPHPGQLSNMPVTQPKEGTILWQMDSGIQSGATTTAHSMTGRPDEEMDNGNESAMGFDWVADPAFTGGITDEMVDEMNQQLNSTRSQRVRAAMFPETLDEVSIR